MDALILVLLVTSLISQQALCQDVAARGTNDKTEGSGTGGQSRAIYSQRHLSPHRMMHFGKRPSNPSPPIIITRQGFDPYPVAERQQLHIQPEEGSPYILNIEMERGQTLQAVPEGNIQQPNKNLIYSFEQPPFDLASLIAAIEEQQQWRQLARPMAGQKSQRLVSNDNSNDNENNGADELSNSAERAQPSSNSQGDNQQQQLSQQQAINVSTRSMQSARSNTLNLPKAYISSLLFARQGSASMPNYAAYNKKAEPKDNFFMHFGRK